MRLFFMSTRELRSFALCLAISPLALGQVNANAPDSSERPLPDIHQFLLDVEHHQRDSEAIQKNYLYHEIATQRQNNGKTEVREYDIFWLNGVEVQKLTRKDGRDLTADEQRKEDEHIDKEVAKAKERKSKADAKGKETDANGHEEITVSRFFALGNFTNPRRVQIDGRDTIAVDFTGDPKAKTQNRAEDAIRQMAGTVWLDEQDRVITRAEGRFVNNFKIGAGLVINVKQGSTFSMQQKKINNEVWLPSQVEGQGSIRALLLINFNGSVHADYSNYRKFKATATILPGVATVNESSPEASNPDSQPTRPAPQ